MTSSNAKRKQPGPTRVVARAGRGGTEPGVVKLRGWAGQEPASADRMETAGEQWRCMIPLLNGPAHR